MDRRVSDTEIKEVMLLKLRKKDSLGKEDPKIILSC